MRHVRRSIGPVCAMAVALLALAACGDDTKLPQAPAASPFQTATVSIAQTSNVDASIDTSSVTFKLDDSRSLVAHLTVRSMASASLTISIRGSIYDPNHALVGDVTGGQIDVPPGGSTPMQLTGPTPQGTIASATFEITATPTPT